MMYVWMLWEMYAPKSVRRQEGQGLVEYALIIALVAILIIAALIALKGQISSTFSNISSGLTTTS
ncbi:MAG: Flp family type IVb pilin [Chloroflexota bacterium]